MIGELILSIFFLKIYNQPVLTCQCLRPLSVPVCLPPVRVLPVDDVEDVAPLEGDAQLVARDVQVVIRVVRKVGTEVKLEEKF